MRIFHSYISPFSTTGQWIISPTLGSPHLLVNGPPRFVSMVGLFLKQYHSNPEKTELPKLVKQKEKLGNKPTCGQGVP